MKRVLVVVLLSALSGVAAAQGDALQGLPSVSAERARIEAIRQRELSVFDAREAECYRRFAVNSCLAKVQSERRATLADLKRQEQVLNDAERRQRGAAQLRLNEEKAQEKLQRDLDAAQTDNAAAQAERKKAQDDKRKAHANAAQGASSAPRTKAAPASPTGSATARTEYERKQQEAAQRRLDAEKRQREKAASKASKPLKPLPVPP
jgi:colicin import membrane protein